MPLTIKIQLKLSILVKMEKPYVRVSIENSVDDAANNNSYSKRC